MRPAQWRLLLASLLFLWPAMVNGGPFFFSDTTAYIRGADAIVEKASGHRTQWFTAPGAAAPAAASAGPRAEAMPVLLGRSAYYGMLLYIGVVAGSLWVPVILQAWIAGLCVIGLVRHGVDPADQRRFAIAVLVAHAVLALTPLPYFACFLMPDLFAGLALVGAIAIIGGWQRERWNGRVGWLALLTAASLFHSSIILILGGLGLSCLTFCALGRRHAFVPAGLALLAAAGIGLIGEATFSLSVTKATGHSPIRPPFLTARLVDDGPGTRFLRRYCPQGGFILCRFADRLPLYSDDFLWQKDPAHGVFMTLTPPEQRRLAAEQARFAIAVLRDDPVGTSVALGRDFAEQTAMLSLREFNYSPVQRAILKDKVPADSFASIRPSAAYRGAMPVFAAEALLWPVTILSFALLAGSIVVPAGRSWQPYAIVAVAGLLINDLVCGCLSTPHPRYQARIVWVLPLVAMLLLAAKRRGTKVNGPAATEAAGPFTFGSKKNP